jgi:hypothetical protein
MSVCLAASLALEGEALVYAGPGGAAWRLDADRIGVVGEFTNAGDGEGHLLAFCIDADGGWFQAPCNAIGADAVLATLGATLGGPIIPRLDNALPCASLVLWPPDLAGGAMFEFPAGRPRLLPRVTDFLARVGARATARGGHA